MNKKIKIVYNKKTGRIVPHFWKPNGTVVIGKLTKEHEPVDDIVVSMVDEKLVDFDTNYVDMKGI